MSGGGEDWSDGLQPIGRLVDRSEESTDGRAVDSRFQNDRVCDDGGRCFGFGGWSVDFESAVFDVESDCGCSCIFLFVDEAIHLGITRFFRCGVGDGSCGGVVSGERFV